MDPSQVARSPETWEKVVRKLRAGMMPPSGAPRPERAAIDEFVGRLETSLDQYAAQHPNPGTVGLHRLNRAEYANAVRDLLALDVDVSTLLPSDDSSEGFDNIADALGVSPALLESYVGAATKISRLAVGDPGITPSTNTWRAPGDLSQTTHIEGLPIGTRGGILFNYTFPLDAEYAFKIRTRSKGFGVGAGALPVPIEITLDGTRRQPGQKSYRFSPPSNRRAPHDRRRDAGITIPQVLMMFMPCIPTTPQSQAWRSPDRRIPPGRVTRPAARKFSSATLLPARTKLPAPNES